MIYLTILFYLTSGFLMNAISFNGKESPKSKTETILHIAFNFLFWPMPFFTALAMTIRDTIFSHEED